MLPLPVVSTFSPFLPECMTLEVKPGQILVLKYQSLMSETQKRHLIEDLKKVGVVGPVLILDEGMELMVLDDQRVERVS